jgi:hypothetical protein
MIRQVKINPVLNGFIVEVGCQAVVFESISKLVFEIERYLKAPEKVEKEYLERAINKPEIQPTGLAGLNQAPQRVPYPSDESARERR